jgi:hypothetical protein
MTDHNAATGHVRVEERAKGQRVWVAEYQVGDGARTRKTLGPAWVRPSGRTTAGVPINRTCDEVSPAGLWRAGHGSKPDASYLTPAEAEVKLAALLDEAKQRRPSAPRAARGKTSGDAITRWLDHVEHEAGVDAAAMAEIAEDELPLMRTARSTPPRWPRCASAARSGPRRSA